MTPTYHSRASPFLIDLNEDLPQPFSSPKPTEAESSSSSLSYTILVNPSQECGGYHHGESQQQEEAKLHGGSCDHPETKTEIDSAGLKFSLHMIKKEDRNGNDQGNNGSVKWMPSKVRLVRKMMSSDQRVSDPPPQKSQQKFGDQKDKHLSSPSMTDDYSSSSSNNNNNAVRVCSDCNTTKTPLWRSGPRGPKSLCNACGIRQRKARRAAAAAAAAVASANGGTVFANDAPPTVKTNKLKVQNKDKNMNNSHLPFKKRCKFTAQARARSKKLCFEDLAISLSKNSAFQRVFPQDEREAAILLMALSYGLVHG